MLSSSCDPLIILWSHVFCSSLLGFSVFSSCLIFLWIWCNSTSGSQPVVLFILVWSATLCSVTWNTPFSLQISIICFQYLHFVGSHWEKHLITVLLSSFVHVIHLAIALPIGSSVLPIFFILTFDIIFIIIFYMRCHQPLFYQDTVNRDFRDYQQSVKRFTCPWDMAKPCRTFLRNFYGYFYSHCNVGICCQCGIGAIYLSFWALIAH